MDSKSSTKWLDENGKNEPGKTAERTDPIRPDSIKAVYQRAFGPVY